MSNTNEGWFPDPMGRHQYRFWSGNAWTEHVSDNGQAGFDPLGPPPAPVVAAAPPPPMGGMTPPPPMATGMPAATPVSQAYQPPAAGQPNAYPQGYVPPPLVAKSPVAWIALAGAVVSLVSLPLHWISIESPLGGSLTRHAFDVPVQFLYDFKTDADGGFSAGVIISILAAVALLASFVDNPGLRIAGRFAGGLVTAVGVLYIVQTSRLVDYLEEPGLGLFDVLGIAPWFAIAGGILIGAGSRR